MASAQDVWEDYARKNAEFYIFTVKGVDFSTDEGRDRFFSSGEKFVADRLAIVRPYLGSTRRALEIGCGIGRLVFPHARTFDEVYAVDVAQTMLDKLRAGAAARGIANVRAFLPDDAWDQPESIDYAYSFLVFQHIADYDIIASYVLRCGAALVPGGVAQLQFDTRPRSLLYRLRNLPPDVLLPKTWRRGIRRIRRSRDELISLFDRAGLRVIREERERSAMHTFILQKPAVQSA